MLQPHEIGRAMAFPTTYEVLGNKRDRVKQYGNAVTPPAMATLIERQVAAMIGERRLKDAHAPDNEENDADYCHC
jgi:DNA (cytosine-5)-methyltransferase 1